MFDNYGLQAKPEQQVTIHDKQTSKQSVIEKKPKLSIT
jgi:hypothetical protein